MEDIIKRIISLILCTVILSGVMCSCESKENNANDNSVSTTTSSIPDEVKEKVKEAAFMESVPIPENGWTDETLLDTVRINGEKVEFPFCLNDLGEAFVPIKDERQYIKDGEGKTNVGYYQNKICYIITTFTSDLNNISNDEIRQFSVKAENEDDIIKGDFPISVNGVTIGSDFNEIYDKLGFEPTGAGKPNENGTFSLIGYSDNYSIVIRGNNMKVNQLGISKRKKR